jgi:hypothetical protein
MTLTETALAGVWLIDADVFADERGSFIRAWMPDELAARGLETAIAQCSMAASHRRGTIRGMHYQTAPFGGSQFVRTVRGSILRRRRRFASGLADVLPWWSVSSCRRRTAGPCTCRRASPTAIDAQRRHRGVLFRLGGLLAVTFGRSPLG